MATASIRTMLPELTRAIMAMVLALAMVAAFVVPAGHAQAGATGVVSIASPSDDGHGSEPGHVSAACHGCLAHAAGLLSSADCPTAPRVTGTNLVAANDMSPPMMVLFPPVEPPRA